MSQEEPPVPLKVRLGFMCASLVVAFFAAEGVLRIADDNALPHLGLFAETESGSIALAPDASMNVRRRDGEVFTVATDACGRRAEERGSACVDEGWLIVGDSQVLGLGVSQDEAFPARLGARNGGVPGFGVADAVAAAQGEDKVVLVLNQANDWEEALAPIHERFDVGSGWLIARGESQSGAGLFWKSPLSRLHLLYYTSMVLDSRGPNARQPAEAPAWLADPSGQAELTAAMVELIETLGEDVVVAWLPLDVASSGPRMKTSVFAPRVNALPAGAPVPWEDRSTREQLGDAVDVDLSDVLDGHPEAWIDGDYHLSAEGHRLVAGALHGAMP